MARNGYLELSAKENLLDELAQILRMAYALDETAAFTSLVAAIDKSEDQQFATSPTERPLAASWRRTNANGQVKPT